MKPPRSLRSAAIAFLLLAAGTLFPAPARAEESGAERRLRYEFWMDLEPAALPGEAWPPSRDEAGRRLFEEAIWVFSGMTWGFDFSYTPLDKTRALQERFELRLLGSIAPADSRLSIAKARVKGSELRAWIEYDPDSFTLAALESYGKEPWRVAQGLGRAALALGYPGRRAAYEDATREALRSLLRSLEQNKPRLVKGRAVFERVPSLMVSDGSYTSQVRLRVQVLEVLPYRVY